MRLTPLQAAIGLAASALFSAQPVLATRGHRSIHNEYARRHSHGHDNGLGHAAAEELVAEVPAKAPAVAKRSTCSLPNDPDLFYVPGASNGGFAMSPNQLCSDGTYCPLACVPGKVMAQWQPNTTYEYPESMNGGLYCNGGTPEKPFPDSPYCVEGTGSVTAVNKCGEPVAFCQTVLPGNEAMLIPTLVSSSATLAVPGPDYWDGTAAHFYINPPGVSTADGCVWGDSSQPVGNWAPYVAGANTDANGLTYVKIGYNPIWTGSSLASTPLTFGIEITCNGGGCNGLPCSINPATDGTGVTDSADAANGAGGASFCVVTVPSGGSANINVFNTDGSSSGASGSGSVSSSSSSSAPPPTTSSTPTSTSVPPTTTSSTTSSAPPTTTSTSTTPTSTSTSVPPTSSTFSTATTTPSSTIASSTPASSTPPSSSAFLGGIFHENSTYTSAPGGGFNADADSQGSSITSAPPAEQPAATDAAAAPVSTTSKSEGASDQGGAAVVGLIVAFVAAATLY